MCKIICSFNLFLKRKNLSGWFTNSSENILPIELDIIWKGTDETLIDKKYIPVNVGVKKLVIKIMGSSEDKDVNILWGKVTVGYFMFSFKTLFIFFNLKLILLTNLKLKYKCSVLITSESNLEKKSPKYPKE